MFWVIISLPAVCLAGENLLLDLSRPPGDTACPGALSAPALTRCICKRIILPVMMRAALPRYVPLRWDKQRKRARKGSNPDGR
jgi:hypothetical protein